MRENFVYVGHLVRGVYVYRSNNFSSEVRHL